MIKNLHFTHSLTRSIAITALAIFMFLPGLGWGQTDDFSDGEFTSNPTWVGNTGDFSVSTATTVPSGAATTDGFFLASGTTNGNVTLSMPSNEVTEWKFSWASPAFAPASGNYIGVILMSNTAVTGSITAPSWNGYFLKLGVDGSTDYIELWKKNGSGTGTKSGEFSAAGNFATNALTNGLNIRVTRNSSGVFQLFYSTGFLYPSTPTTSAGTVTDNTITTSNYFGVFTVLANPGTSRRVYIDNIVLGGTTPTISVSPTSLSGFTYLTGSGPSTSQSYNLSGSNLSPASGDITITPSTNYEVSLDNSTFSQTAITKSYTSGTLASTPVHVRLKAGLSVGNYNSENISNAGGTATTANVTCSGTVTTPPPPNAPAATAATNPASTSFTANWIASSGATGYRLDVYTKTVGANASDLFISEYVEGSSNNKYIEIYNGTGSAVDLGGYKLQLYTNGSGTAANDITLSGTLANGATVVYKNSAAALTLPGGVTATANAAVNFNGDDAVALYKISTSSYVDIFGRIGDDPGSAWTGDGGYTTVDKTLVRKSTVSGGITTSPSGTGATAFTTLTTEWDLYNIDIVANLGSHTFAGGTTNTPVYTDVNVGNVTSYPVTGLSPATTYYYVVRAVNSGGTSANSTEIAVTTNYGTKTTDAAGDWNTATIWNDDIVPTATDNVTINHVVTLAATADCHNLTIGTGGSLLVKTGASFIPHGSVTGNISVELELKGGSFFQLFTPPVSTGASTALGFYTGAYLDRYDEASGEWYRLVNADAVPPMVGYSINYASAKTLTFSGPIYTDNRTFNGLTALGTTSFGAGWNLVGNPFTSAVKTTQGSWASSGLTGYKYVWNATGNNYLVAPDLGPLTTLPDSEIPAMQGFFVRATGPGSGSLTVPADARVHGSYNFYKSADAAAKDALFLTIEGNGYSDKAIVAFNPAATTGFDGQYDAYKLMGGEAAPQLYSILPGEIATVNSLPSVFTTENVPLGLKVGASATYTLAVNGTDSFDASVPIRLVDLKLGTSQDLRTNPTYTFTAAPGDAENRFNLSFGAVTGLDKNLAGSIRIYTEQQRQVTISSQVLAKGTAYVYSASGQLVATRAINPGETRLSLRAPGVYMVKVVSGTSVTTGKVVVY